jgi:parvulin-like peptidyl-prolyl isomerase
MSASKSGIQRPRLFCFAPLDPMAVAVTLRFIRMRLFCALLVVSLLPVLAGKARADLARDVNLADAIEVTVHDSIVTSLQVLNEASPAEEELRRQYRNDPEGYRKRYEQLLQETADALIERQLVLHDFDTSGLKVPEGVIEDYIQQQIREVGDRATLIRTLQAKGITYERFHKQARDRFIVQQMHYIHVSEALVISPHKIEAYYLQHTNDFKITEEVKLRMIVLTNAPDSDTSQTRKLAEEILARINDGAKFSEMASIYSQGSQRSQGGDWGWVQKYNNDGAPVLRKELFDVAFTLKPGGRSGVIETPEAFYLMSVDDVRPEHIVPLSEVRGKIEDILLTDERNRLQKQWIERLKKKTFVRYF